MTWAAFLRGQAEAIIAADFFETVTLTGTRLYVLAVIEHATRRIRILGATPHPTAAWVIQTIRNLVMDLEDAGCSFRYLVRDRDGKYPVLIDAILADAGIRTVLTGVRMPRMNSIIERWIQTCRHELPRPHPHLQPGPPPARPARVRNPLQHPPIPPGIAGSAPLRPLPQPIDPGTAPLRIDRYDRLGGILHEYQHAA
jgi:transposase InsO family protein